MTLEKSINNKNQKKTAKKNALLKKIEYHVAKEPICWVTSSSAFLRPLLEESTFDALYAMVTLSRKIRV